MFFPRLTIKPVLDHDKTTNHHDVWAVWAHDPTCLLYAIAPTEPLGRAGGLSFFSTSCELLWFAKEWRVFEASQSNSQRLSKTCNSQSLSSESFKHSMAEDTTGDGPGPRKERRLAPDEFGLGRSLASLGRQRHCDLQFHHGRFEEKPPLAEEIGAKRMRGKMREKEVSPPSTSSFPFFRKGRGLPNKLF